MKKLWLVAKTTYRQGIRSGTFLMLTFGLPILMVIAGAVPILMESDSGELPRLGYVDESGQLADVASVAVEDEQIDFQGYEDRAAAEAAYNAGEIGGYLVVPASYFSDGQADYYAAESPGERLNEGLRSFMRHALAPDAPDWLFERLNDAATRTFVSLNTGEELEEGPGLLVQFLAPFGLAIFFALATFLTSSQMGATIVREKDQRAMEIVITSLSATELVAGKILGMSLLSLTQITIWGIGAAGGLGFYLSNQIDLGPIPVPWEALIWSVLLGIPGYLLFAVTASGLGLIAGSSEQAQQLAGLLGVVGMAPMWLIGAFLDTPNNSLAVGLTMFPFTAPPIALLRMAMTEVPLWQLLASLAILVASVLLGMWAVARLFRGAMLIYGKALNPREILQALRQS